MRDSRCNIRMTNGLLILGPFDSPLGISLWFERMGTHSTYTKFVFVQIGSKCQVIYIFKCERTVSHQRINRNRNTVQWSWQDKRGTEPAHRWIKRSTSLQCVSTFVVIEQNMWIFLYALGCAMMRCSVLWWKTLTYELSFHWQRIKFPPSPSLTFSCS